MRIRILAFSGTNKEFKEYLKRLKLIALGM